MEFQEGNTVWNIISSNYVASLQRLFPELKLDSSHFDPSLKRRMNLFSLLIENNPIVFLHLFIRFSLWQVAGAMRTIEGDV